MGKKKEARHIYRFHLETDNPDYADKAKELEAMELQGFLLIACLSDDKRMAVIATDISGREICSAIGSNDILKDASKVVLLADMLSMNSMKKDKDE